MDMENNKPAMAGACASTESNTDHITPSSCVNDNNKLYKGVRKRKWGKWVSEIRLPNSRERIWLGSYDSPQKAARAFDAALFCLRGRHASFNFPDTPCNLDINVARAGDQSLTPQEIQEVAAKFANKDPHDHHHQIGGDGGDSLFGSKFSKMDNNSIEESSITNIASTPTTTTTASSCSTTMYEHDHGVQVDHGDMDWTFLNVFDYSNEVVPVGSDYGLYSELDQMHSGELLYSTPPPPPFEYNEIESDDDPFSHQSFLWNWSF